MSYREGISRLLREPFYRSLPRSANPELKSSLSDLVSGEWPLRVAMNKQGQILMISQFRLSETGRNEIPDFSSPYIMKRGNDVVIATDITPDLYEIRKAKAELESRSGRITEEEYMIRKKGLLAKTIFNTIGGLTYAYARKFLPEDQRNDMDQIVNGVHPDRKMSQREINILKQSGVTPSKYLLRVYNAALSNQMTTRTHGINVGTFEKVDITYPSMRQDSFIIGARWPLRNENSPRQHIIYISESHSIPNVEVGNPYSSLLSQQLWPHLNLSDTNFVLPRNHNETAGFYSLESPFEAQYPLSHNENELIEDPFNEILTKIPRSRIQEWLDGTAERTEDGYEIVPGTTNMFTGYALIDDFEPNSGIPYEILDYLSRRASERDYNGHFAPPIDTSRPAPRTNSTQSAPQSESDDNQESPQDTEGHRIRVSDTELTTDRRPTEDSGIVGIISDLNLSPDDLVDKNERTRGEGQRTESGRRTDIVNHNEYVRQTLSDIADQLTILNETDYDKFELKRPTGGGHTRRSEKILTSRKGQEALKKLIEESDLISKSKVLKDMGLSASNFRGFDAFTILSSDLTDDLKRKILPFAGYTAGGNLIVDNNYNIQRFAHLSGFNPKFWKVNTPRQNINRKLVERNPGLYENIRDFDINNDNIELVNLPGVSINDVDRDGLIIPVERNKAIYVPPFADLSYTFGLEFELSSRLGVREANDILMNKIKEKFGVDLRDLALDREGAKAVEDASVHSGHEIVAGVFTGITGLKALYYLTETLKELGYRGGINSRGDMNGIHINIGSIERNLRTEATKFAADYIRLTEEIYKRAFIPDLRYKDSSVMFSATGMKSGIESVPRQVWRHFWFAGMSKFRKLATGDNEYDYLREHGKYPDNYNLSRIISTSSIIPEKIAKYKFMSFHKLLLNGIGEFRIFGSTLKPEFYMNQLFISLKMFDDIRNGARNGVSLPKADKLIPHDKGWTNKENFKKVIKAIMAVDDKSADFLFELHQKCKRGNL